MASASCSQTSVGQQEELVSQQAEPPVKAILRPPLGVAAQIQDLPRAYQQLQYPFSPVARWKFHEVGRLSACLSLKLQAHLRHIADVSQFFSSFSSKSNSYCSLYLLHPPAFFLFFFLPCMLMIQQILGKAGTKWQFLVPGGNRSRTRQQLCSLGPAKTKPDHELPHLLLSL